MQLALLPAALEAGFPSPVLTIFHGSLANTSSVPDDTFRSFKTHTDAITTCVQY